MKPYITALSQNEILFTFTFFVKRVIKKYRILTSIGHPQNISFCISLVHITGGLHFHMERNALPVLLPSQPDGLVRHKMGLDHEWGDRLNMKVTGKMLCSYFKGNHKTANKHKLQKKANENQNTVLKMQTMAFHLHFHTFAVIISE